MIRINWAGLEAPLVTLTTFCGRRPVLLAKCMRSAAAQSVPVEQLLLEDGRGRGFAWVGDELRANAHQPRGEWVLQLDDDDELLDLAPLLPLLRDPEAEVIMARFEVSLPHGRVVLPDRWMEWPAHGHCTGGATLARTAVWRKHLNWYRDVGYGAYAADFGMIQSYFTANRRVRWADVLIGRALNRDLAGEAGVG